MEAAKLTVSLRTPFSNPDCKPCRAEQIGDLLRTDNTGVELDRRKDAPLWKLWPIADVCRSHADADHIFTRTRLALHSQHFAVDMECSPRLRSEEHTSELQSLMLISYAVFCLKKKKSTQIT